MWQCIMCWHHFLPQAAEDARRQMGNRRFYDQILQDTCHHHQLSVTDEIDVSTMKDYMQVSVVIDECAWNEWHTWC